MFVKVFSALVLAGVAAAQALTINTPPSLIQCQPSSLSWSGGTGPYILAVIPGEQTTAPAIATINDNVSSSPYTWIVDIPAGTFITIRITDSTGNNQYSSALTVQAGGNGCLSGGAASSGAASASSAASSAPMSSGAAASVSSVSSAASSAVSSASAAVSSSAASASSAVASAASSARPSSSSSAAAMSSSASRPASSTPAASSSAAAAPSGAANMNAYAPILMALGAIGAALFAL